MDEMEEELAVSLRSEQPRVYDADHAAAPVPSRLRQLAQHPRVNVEVTDDAALRFGAAGLELRLDEDQRTPAGRGDGQRGRQREPERDEGHVARDQVRGIWQRTWLAYVRALDHHDPGVVPQPRMELAVAHVERDHVRGAVLQQTVGEAACRRADVESARSRDVDVEVRQRVLELLAATGDIAGRLLDDELCALVDLLARLLVSPHAAREHERLRLRAAVGEPALNKQHVQALLHRWKRSAQAVAC